MIDRHRNLKQKKRLFDLMALKQVFFCSGIWPRYKHILFLMLLLLIASAAITEGVFMLLSLRYALFALSAKQKMHLFSLSWSAYGYVVLSLFSFTLGCFTLCVAIYDGCRGKQQQQLATLEEIENDK